MSKRGKLCLGRRELESIILHVLPEIEPTRIEVTVVEIRRGYVRIAIEAPGNTVIVRKEIERTTPAVA